MGQHQHSVASIGATRFEITLRKKSDFLGVLKIIGTKIELMFPEYGKKSTHINRMATCASEIANNAAKKEEHFPITIKMERRNGSLFFETLQAKKFENPPIKLPDDDMQEGGRGLFIVDGLTGHNLHLEGEKGIVWFTYSLNGKSENKAAKKAMERAQPLVGD